MLWATEVNGVQMVCAISESGPPVLLMEEETAFTLLSHYPRDTEGLQLLSLIPELYTHNSVGLSEATTDYKPESRE